MVVADPRTQRLRTLTPIECERLNGFPDDWTAGMPERLRYFTMGNALVVPLVKAMGKRISALAEDEQRRATSGTFTPGSSASATAR